VTLTTIDNGGLSYTGLMEADFQACPELALICGGALDPCSSLREVSFGASLEYRGGYAFKDCPSLTTLDFQPCHNLGEIGREAFKAVHRADDEGPFRVLCAGDGRDTHGLHSVGARGGP
jgi:hypothetical protein